jgi:hypothetical protein
MVRNLIAPLRRALRQLEAAKQRIDGQITAVNAALRTLGDKGQQTRATTRAQVRRHRMSAAVRKAVSKRMKAYWAKRRAVKIKGGVKTKGD